MNKRSISLRGAALLVAAAAGALSLAGCGSSDAASLPAAATPAPQLAGVTAVLVHGAWADGSSWAQVTPLLQARGVEVVAVQLHLTSLAEDAATVRRALEGRTGKVLLVGHSYGGAVITEAGVDPKVGALVYVAAFAPGDGESVNDLVSPYPPAPWTAGLVPDSAGYLKLTASAYQTFFASDLPKEQSAVLATAQGPTGQAVLLGKITNAAWKTRPAYWALSDSDQMIPPGFQDAEAARLKARVTLVRGAGHTAMLSHPQDVANVILDAAARL
jgi:pimeloyl-ACP methyl ester carboxylesterase